MNEWWQEGQEDGPVPVPRRDSIPDANFSDPGDVGSTPELATFIPEFRARRRVIAIVASVVALGGILWSLFDLHRIMSLPPCVRSQESLRFFVIILAVTAVVGGLVLTWQWANRKDPRDLKEKRL